MKLLLISLMAVLISAAPACSDTDIADPGARQANDTAVNDTVAASVTAAGGLADPGEGIDPPVRRIVSISPSATEMLWAMDAADLVVAVDSLSSYPDGTPVTDIEAWNPNIEVVAGYEPDMVVMQSNSEIESALMTLGIAVLAQPAPATLDEVYAQIIELGTAIGRETQAAVLAQDMRNQIANLIADAPDGTGITYYHELDDTLYSVTGGTFIGEVYSLFGLRNVADPVDADNPASGYPQLSDEFLLDADPDLIFLADTLCCGQNAETVSKRPGWAQLSAVRNGNVIELDDDVVSRWGPRLVVFVTDIAIALKGIVAGL